MMEREKFIEIFKSTESIFNWKGDNAFQGLQIIAKYIDPNEHVIIQGAGHDEIWSVDVEELCKTNITEDDVLTLKKLNWSIEDGCYLKCYV